ncbi:amidase domain-containing protein [Mesorhizobium sp.]|uniref:amidase domain-containing protein n=1 Tax=Mesorhizobium sp. TaxID=1871066 RepID=UPI000FE51822|nr:amidase domain-containing protein [Mesorhizobium sp.]RWB69718.1 MAG: hypothetical protein EOQ49_19780 [Mesorhizobium sp.]
MARMPYDNWKAITHAKAWCGKQDNPCGVYLQGDKLSDCAHFMAHCLNAGGFTIKSATNDGLCPDGLSVKNTELVSAMRDAVSQYENVKEIGLSDGIVGDVGFLDRPDRPYHAFMVCEPFDLGDPTDAPKVYAHSTSRCCERMDTSWRHWFSTMFRLEDG